MAYACAHVDAMVLRIDDDGCIWRDKISRRGSWAPIVSRRAENPGSKGYLRVSLNVHRQGLAIVMAHRLVYEVLVGRIPDGLEINHKDLDKQNNKPGNLEPVTGSQNIQHSYDNGRSLPWSHSEMWRPGRPIVTDEAVAEARHMRRHGVRLREIAQHLGISITHAHRITSETQ